MRRTSPRFSNRAKENCMATIYKPGDKDNTRQRTPVQARAKSSRVGR
jgi:hypothetical protein